MCNCVSGQSGDGKKSEVQLWSVRGPTVAWRGQRSAGERVQKHVYGPHYSSEELQGGEALFLKSLQMAVIPSKKCSEDPSGPGWHQAEPAGAPTGSNQRASLCFPPKKQKITAEQERNEILSTSGSDLLDKMVNKYINFGKNIEIKSRIRAEIYHIIYHDAFLILIYRHNKFQLMTFEAGKMT